MIDIKVERIKQGITQDGLAQLANIKRLTVAGIESGKQKPSLDTYVALIGALGYRLEIVPISKPVYETVEPLTSEKLLKLGTEPMEVRLVDKVAIVAQLKQDILVKEEKVVPVVEPDGLKEFDPGQWKSRAPVAPLVPRVAAVKLVKSVDKK